MLRTIQFTNNIGGLNTRASEILIKTSESPDLLNVKLTKQGTIEKEKGYVLYNNTTLGSGVEVGGIYHFVKNNGSSEYTVVGAGTKLYIMQSNSFTDISRAASYTNNASWDFVTFNNLCIAVNGSNEPQKYDGVSNASNLGGTPPTSASCVEVFKNRVFMAGEQANPTKLSYSALSNPENWTAANDAGWIEVGLNDGQRITGLKAFYDVLLIFKESSIYVLSGYSGDASSPGYFFIKPLNAEIGAVSNRAIIQVGNDIYFISKKGIYSLKAVQTYGDLSLSSISGNIQSLLDKLNIGSINNSFIVGDYDEDRLWFFVPNGSSIQNDLILIYDYHLRCWTKRSGFSSKSGHVVKSNISGTNIFYTGSYNGYIYKQKTGYSYNGTPINSYYITPWLDLGNYRIRKRIRDIQLVMVPTGGYNLGVSYQWNYGDSNNGNINYYLADNTSLWGESNTDENSAEWDISKWDAPSIIKIAKSINGGGNVIRLKFWNSNANEHFIILGWLINFIEGGIR